MRGLLTILLTSLLLQAAALAQSTSDDEGGEAPTARPAGDTAEVTSKEPKEPKEEEPVHVKAPNWGWGASRFRVLQRKRIYFGDPLNFQKPATVHIRRVFAMLPEIRQARSLSREEAQYWILVNRAKTRVTRAVGQVAKKQGYDLIAEEGALLIPEGTDPPPDVTDAVIAAALR